jgi:hypothetical protein
MTEPWHRPFKGALRACVFVTAHTIVLVYFQVLIYVLSWLLEDWPKTRQATAFGVVPWSYVFDFAHVALLLTYVIYGTVEAIRVFRGSEAER